MCGIAGYIDPSSPEGIRREAVTRMCDAMVHRGPDDSGIETQGPATLGMRRLAIFDPANGHQPMSTPDGRHTLVFNGAIYNFRALRDELAAGGWAFRTQCDTEVLLAAYATWGEGCLGRLRGMFAFAVWDAREQTLFLARDPFGIKPLYYRQDGTRLLFASELNALCAASAFSAEIDPRSMGDYLAWFAVPAPRTIYRGVFSLRPGECATFRAGRLEVRVAWSFRSIPRAAKVCTSREEFIRELRGRLDDSIRAHVVADVPVGAFLSGGLDSTAIVGLMTRATGSQLRTFSIGFEEAEYSEASDAERAARHFGAAHSTHILTGAEVARDLDKLVAAFDQPTGDGINTYYASRAARAGGVTVALSGLGGDELFGSYPSFRDLPRLARWLPVWSKLPRGVRNAILSRLRRGDTRRRKLADFLQHARSLHDLGALQRRVFSTGRQIDLLHRDARGAIINRSPYHPEVDALADDLDDAGSFETISAWELRTYMTDVLLRDSDVMSMHQSLELRVPFVDRPLIEWLWRQPAAFKSDPRSAKTALRDAVRDVLPPEFLRERPKRGFTLPFARWMKRELRPFLEETFSSPTLSRSNLFDTGAVQKTWQGFVSGNDPREWSRVWSLAMAVAFANRRLAAPSPRIAPPASISSEKLREAPRSPAPLPLPNQPAPTPERTIRSRTLLIAPEIFVSEGGITRILQIYLKALCDLAGADQAVRLLALNDAVVDSIDLRRTSSDTLEDWFVCTRHKPRFVRAALRMSRGCDRLICGHVAQLPVAWAARQLNRRLRYYLVAHGIEVWRPFTLAERIALRGAEKIFCVSDFTRRELLRHCPLPEGRAVVLHNALDPWFEIAPGAPLAACPPVILVVTRLTYSDRYKGVEHMIQAMPAIRAAIPNATLRIIGRGDDLPRLQMIRNQLGLATAVEFLGYVNDKRMDAELRACRLFALPSEREGFGLVFLEAMAHGRPCLGARAGGIPEVIDADTGVLATYGDVPGIATAAIGALHREWNEQTILNRARHFSYSPFKDRLASLLASPA
ncbi:MAG TPA: asparagine synthase (glutamine-hydrolyzing) [Opitutaceae bacterium]|nr:asparagine synthase (glutamine-hydrolyzing) [Opitutaceae bacterium]